MTLDQTTVTAICGAIVAICTLANSALSLRNGRKIDQHASRAEETHAETLAAIQAPK
jgi:hypothetical protein